MNWNSVVPSQNQLPIRSHLQVKDLADVSFGPFALSLLLHCMILEASKVSFGQSFSFSTISSHVLKIRHVQRTFKVVFGNHHSSPANKPPCCLWPGVICTLLSCYSVWCSGSFLLIQTINKPLCEHLTWESLLVLLGHSKSLLWNSWPYFLSLHHNSQGLSSWFLFHGFLRHYLQESQDLSILFKCWFPLNFKIVNVPLEFQVYFHLVRPASCLCGQYCKNYTSAWEEPSLSQVRLTSRSEVALSLSLSFLFLFHSLCLSLWKLLMSFKV